MHIVSQVRKKKSFGIINLFEIIFYFQDDAYWWQARKETDKTTRAGLIPSRALQERRIMHERSQMAREMSASESKSEFMHVKVFFKEFLDLNSKLLFQSTIVRILDFEHFILYFKNRAFPLMTWSLKNVLKLL